MEEEESEQSEELETDRIDVGVTRVTYGRHYVSKSGGIFFTTERRMIVSMKDTFFLVDAMPKKSGGREIINYRDVISLRQTQSNSKEILLIYLQRTLPKQSTNMNTQLLFKSENRDRFISDFYTAYDTFQASRNKIASVLRDSFQPSQPSNISKLSAQYIADKATKSYCDVTLHAFSTHLVIHFLPSVKLDSNKFSSIQYYNVFENKLNNESNNKSHNIGRTPNKAKTQKSQKKPKLFDSINASSKGRESLVIRFMDIWRIQRKLNGFSILMSQGGQILNFFSMELNSVNSFLTSVQRGQVERTEKEVSVTSTVQEEIHEEKIFSEQEVEVDFAILAQRVLPSRLYKRKCLLALGKGGLIEVDRHDGQIYESHNLKYLKDIVREEQRHLIKEEFLEFLSADNKGYDNRRNGEHNNNVRLIFMNGIDVEYRFEPFQRDLFIVELLTNINIYFDNSSPCRRCLDIIHSRMPEYDLEIQGGGIDGGATDRDTEVDLELMRNMMTARGEDPFFEAVSEFNVNCNLKNTPLADITIYRQLLSVADKYIQEYNNEDILQFIKHWIIISTIPYQNIPLIDSREETNGITDKKQVELKERIQNLHRRQVTDLLSPNGEIKHPEVGHFSSISTPMNINISNITSIKKEEHEQFEDITQTSVCSQISTSNNDTSLLTPYKTKEIKLSSQEPPKLHKLSVLHRYGQKERILLQEIRLKSVQSIHTILNILLDDEKKPTDYQKQENVKKFQIQTVYDPTLKAGSQFNDFQNKQPVESGKQGHIEKCDQKNEKLEKFESLFLKIQRVILISSKVEELLKCLSIFQNCRGFFEDKAIKLERIKQFRSVFELLMSPQPLMVYQTSQFVKKIGLYYNNLMQKAETENKNFLMEQKFELLEKAIYLLSCFTLKPRELSEYRFIIRIHSCLNVVSALFNTRVESTSPAYRQAIVAQLQAPLFFAVVNKILRYNSFAFVLSLVNLLNALLYFSTENKQFVNMILLNSTLLIFLLHLLVQNVHSSQHLKDIAFNLFFALTFQQSNSCYIIMNVFPKPLFKMVKTEQLFVDHWNQQEWHQFIFTFIQTDIKTPYCFWLKSNLMEEVHQKMREEGSQLEYYFDKVFESGERESTEQKNELIKKGMEEQRDVFAGVYWNGEEFRVNYPNVSEQLLCGRHYLQQLVSESKRNLLFEFIDNKGKVMEKEIRDLWENLVGMLMSKHQQFINLQQSVNGFEQINEPPQLNEEAQVNELQQQRKQEMVIRTMTIVYKEYSNVIKSTNILNYLIHLLNLHEYSPLQYTIIQLVYTIMTTQDEQAKRQHNITFLNSNHIQSILNLIFSRTTTILDETVVAYPLDSTVLKMPQVLNRSQENIHVIIISLKIIMESIQLHSHLSKNRKIFPLTNSQRIVLQTPNFHRLQNLLLLPKAHNNATHSHALLRNEFLKFIQLYLVNDHILNTQGLPELLIEQLTSFSQQPHTYIDLGSIQKVIVDQSILGKHSQFINNNSEISPQYNTIKSTQHKYNYVQFDVNQVQQSTLLYKEEDILQSDGKRNLQQSEILHYDPNTVKEKRNLQESEIYHYNPKTVEEKRNLQESEILHYDLKTVEENINLQKSDILNYDPKTVEEKINLQKSDILNYDPKTVEEKINLQKSDILNYDPKTVEDNIISSPAQYCQFNQNIRKLNESSMYITFKIMKILFFRLKNAKRILIEILNGEGVQRKHMESYPFFKFFPVQFLLPLLVEDSINLNSSVPPQRDISVEIVCENFKTEKIDRFDIIWNNSMQSMLAENVDGLIRNHREQVNEFYINHFKPGGEWHWKDYSIVTQDLFNRIPVLRDSLLEPIQYPQLTYEITLCAVYIRPWSDRPHIHIPPAFPYQTINFIKLYSFQPLQFPLTLTNLIHIIQASSKLYLLKQADNIIYPYQHLLSILTFYLTSLRLTDKTTASENYSQISKIIHKILKLIFLSIKQKSNIDIFCENNEGIKCILEVIKCIADKIQKKEVGRNNFHEYFEEVRVDWSLLKMARYSVEILQEIFEKQKDRLKILSAEERVQICLSLQRLNKISVSFFNIFFEKSMSSCVYRKASKAHSTIHRSLVRSYATVSLLGHIASPISSSVNIQDGNSISALSYKHLLPKLFEVDQPELNSIEEENIIDKSFQITRTFNVTLSRFMRSLSTLPQYVNALVTSGCAWRGLELILILSKPQNTLPNPHKQENLDNLRIITHLSAQMLSTLLLHCEVMTKLFLLEPNASDVSTNIIDFNVKQKKSHSITKNQTPTILRNKLMKKDKIMEDPSNVPDITDFEEALRSLSRGKPKSQHYNAQSVITEEDNSDTDEISSAGFQSDNKAGSSSSEINIQNLSPKGDNEKGGERRQIFNANGEDDNDNLDEMEIEQKKNRTEEEKKELIFVNMQFLREVGALGRDKLQFFVQQFMIALTKSVDNHLLRYLKEQKYDQFTRKINSNLEFPDFIWNNISRDNLDLNLKLQILNVNASLGKTFLDRLLEHQGIIQIDDIVPQGSSNIVDQTGGDSTPQPPQELQICGIYLRLFNDSDNFEVTNPQTFQQEIFLSLKKSITEIQEIISTQGPAVNYDSLAVNELFPQQIKAIKECFKATLSLLSRYSVHYIVLNTTNMTTLFKLLQMEMDQKINVSTFKLVIVKILNEIAGSEQGSKILISSQIYVRYVLSNLIECSGVSTQIIQQIQKLSRLKENQEILIREGFVAVLLINVLKKEYFKQPIRVLIVEVLNEINTDSLFFQDYMREKMVPRIFQRLFQDQPQQVQRSTMEIIDTLDTVSLLPDLIWTNLMRIELIMVLEQEVRACLKGDSISRFVPVYPELQNEVQCCQVFLRIYNQTPSYIKFSELQYLSAVYNTQKDSTASFTDVFLDRLIELSANYHSRFITLQEEILSQNKLHITQSNEESLNEEECENEDSFLNEFDRVSTSYITTITSLMFCLEYVIMQEKKNIKESQLVGICRHFSVLGKSKSHLHLKSTILQIAYLLKDQPNITRVYIDSKFYENISQALSQSLDYPLELDSLSSIEHIVLLNLLIKIVRDKENPHREETIEVNKNYCLPIISRFLESIAEESSFIKAHIISYCAEMLRSGFFFDDISAIIDQTTFSSKQLSASKNTHCEVILKKFVLGIIIFFWYIVNKWVNLWRPCILNYDESYCLSELQQRQHQEISYDICFSLPVQSEFSIENISFPPQAYLNRLQEVQEYKQIYEKELNLKKNPQQSIIDSANI